MAEAVPDSATPIVGWRLWNPFAIQFVDGCGPRPYAHSVSFRLFSMKDTDHWPMREAKVARCIRTSTDHAAPTEGCTCGIHAFSSLPRLLTGANREARILIGEVNLWGKVVLTERGYRAQYAYPKRLIVTPDLTPKYEAMVTELEWAYGVPIERMTWEDVLRSANLW